MRIRLAGGVVASDLRAWTPGPSGPVEPAEEPGVAVALGPAEATSEEIGHAVAELEHLVKAGGVVAAGAGVDLGDGFRSARLEGARGDQRDAVLAALRVLGVDGAHRLGERTGFLVALFGPAVTKRVGAAAAAAIGEGRWAALHLASAASDTLGPEQLERVLALTAPEGVAPDGPPSALARHLKQVLEPVAAPRRLDLVLDLWARVLEHHADSARRVRRRRSQSRRDGVQALRERRKLDDDEHILSWLTANRSRREPSLADAARWVPPDRYWYVVLDHLVEDALAATALLRTAVAVADHGLEEGLKRSEPLIGGVGHWTSDPPRRSVRKVRGMTQRPARPGAYVRALDRRMAADRPRDAKFAAYVQARLSSARDYALLVIESVEDVLDESFGARDNVLRAWAAQDLASWREGAGYTDVRPPAEWGGIPPWSTPILDGREPLYNRLAAAGPGKAAEEEVVGDLLWYAELVDALAQVYGHDAARPTPGIGAPWFDHDPPPHEAEPLAPRLDAITPAVSGAAQLVALGGVPPKGARTWRAFTEGLLAGTAITEALTGDFDVPAPLAALDGTPVPGTGLRVRVARSARMLAEWADHMGNCIAGPDYSEDARAGRSALMGLYDKDGVLVVNAEIYPLRPATKGWRVTEIAARFNDAPDQRTETAFRDWIATVATVAAQDAEEPAPVDDGPPVRPVRRRPRPVDDAGPALGALARQAWADEVGAHVLGTLAALAGTSPDAAVTRLRRLGPDRLAGACRHALDTGAVDLDRLWAATAVRPLRTAVDALDPALRDRLAPLFGEPPLPRSLRRLVRLPEIADAHALDAAARAVRGAIGRLAGDPLVARALADRTTEPMLCALTVTTVCRAPAIERTPVAPPGVLAVPGYPATGLGDEDGPWQRALPYARELGADTGVFDREIAEHGLWVPTSWLGAGGWTALWSRAHRR
jgi:hypothetical protein